MNKRELVDAVAERAGQGTPRRQVEDVLDAFIATVTEALRQGDDVTLTGFGKFEARERAARIGQNPRTGERIRIAATTVPAFRPGTQLREALAVKKTAAKRGVKKAAAKKAAAKKAAAKKAAAKKAATKKAARKGTRKR